MRLEKRSIFRVSAIAGVMGSVLAGHAAEASAQEREASGRGPAPPEREERNSARRGRDGRVYGQRPSCSFGGCRRHLVLDQCLTPRFREPLTPIISRQTVPAR